jgi:hypothetical protein
VSVRVRCAGPRCSAEAPPIVAADRWAGLDWRGRRYPTCSQLCMADVVLELVTVGGFARRPAPPPPPLSHEDGVTADRHDGVPAVRR